ncbi:MAG: heme ABC transporter ATP-binding protein [Myxococcales bacterium 68-20]|nr:heme ABC transporter ATP-binding protein [Myxococcales bacterium]OJY23872.1 MAG: heme ABC transporter ATP-binding protein [Myxococcales bacterium 68-20]
MITARNVTRHVGGAKTLDDVSIEVPAGSVLALVGPNGAGKSTLLKVLSGEITPTSGEVTMAGKLLSSWSPRERAKMRAVLPQDAALAFPLSAYDVVLLGRLPHEERREPSRDRAIARLSMSATDTLELADRSYPTLSGGERQRVQTSRALAQIWEGGERRVLLLDEPTSSLDLAHQHATLRCARRLASEGCAVACVLHDLNLAAQYADRIGVLHRGKLKALGAPADILTAELLEEVFDVRAAVVTHPELSCPLVVTLGPTTSECSDASRGVGEPLAAP